jgi:hypothetical protein
MKHEKWLPIPGYEARYEVSNFGQVRVSGIDAIGRKRCHGRILSPCLHRGYTAVLLHLNSVKKNFLVHRLVMLAFVGPCPEGHNVNHKDGNKTNPRLENLEYVTRSENYRHALTKLGFKPPHGERHWACKLNEGLIREIRARCDAGERQMDVAAELNLRRSYVSQIVNRIRWKHVI